MHPVLPRSGGAAFAWMVLAIAAVAPAADWPTFRGADRTAIAPDTDLLESWPDQGPPVVWEARGAGRGYASLAIAGDRLFTLGDGLSTAADKDEYLSCFDRATGRQLWRTKTGEPWSDGQESWQSSRSTPTVDGDLVYMITPFGKLVACQTEDGGDVFRVDLTQQFGGKKGDSWGYSESVLVDGDRLVCTPGGEQGAMVALDKRTGQPLWTCAVPGIIGAGHSSVVIAEVKGRRIYVQSTASGPIGVDAVTGSLLWSYPVEKTTAIIPTPIVRDDLVFFTAGYKRGGALLRQVPVPGGGVTIEEVYPLNPELANKHGGVVLVGNHLYGCADDQPILVCADLRTGEIAWKERGSGRNSATVMAADGHVYVRYADGTVALVKADSSAYQEVSTFKVPGSGDRPSWAHMVILDGLLYIREGDSILCYDLRVKAP
ncbi:MAG: PQQ-binding-like beta-propeller repeat protein [Planctomycetota bacterium]